MNPYVSVFSSTAVTAQNDNSRRKVLTTASTTLSVYLKMMVRKTVVFYLLPSGWNATQLIGPK